MTTNLNEIVREHSNATIRLSLWHGANETRIYAKRYNGSRGRPWIDSGYISIVGGKASARDTLNRNGWDEVPLFSALGIEVW